MRGTADPHPRHLLRPGRRSYAGAAAALAAGAVTFVSSLAMAVGIQFSPTAEQAPGKHQAHRSTPRVVESRAARRRAPLAVEPPRRPAAREPVSRQDAPEGKQGTLAE
ncbi:hypothetical protein [Mycobacterium tilburgii]|uniref:hypothetical protein n=1 Tax=Mycobacterium tilburgii TaxID=44467 RepID=UPI0021B301DF|nr:hypothetical protein [Mycobacterium tilburgii]